MLVHWAGLPPAEATWENAIEFHESYLEFMLEDKLVVQEGSNVAYAFMGKKYSRRTNKRALKEFTFYSFYLSQ